MPLMVKIEPNPDYKGTAQDKAVFETVVARGTLEVDQVTASENIRLSKGMYRIKPDVAAPVEVAPMSYESMSNDEVQLMALSLGMKVSADKTVKRSEMVSFIKAKLAAVTVTDD